MYLKLNNPYPTIPLNFQELHRHLICLPVLINNFLVGLQHTCFQRGFMAYLNFKRLDRIKNVNSMKGFNSKAK